MEILTDERAMQDTDQEAGGRLPSYVEQIYGVPADFIYRQGLLDQLARDGSINPTQLTAQQPTVILTGYDLRPPNLNFCFGMTYGNVAIISTARLSRNPWRITTVLLHEVGHLLGLVPETASSHDNRHFFEGHCSNQCLMQGINSLADIDIVVAQMKQGRPLCRDCATHFNRP